MRVGIDAMGGDQAPAPQVQGALAARELLGAEDRIVLVGREEPIRRLLDDADGDWSERIEIRHAPDVIGMDDPPVETLRARPGSSVAVMIEMHRDGELDACISAGNTGAFVAAAQMRLRRLRGVHRPGIAIITPTYRGPVAVCDVGANVNCRPKHLYQYAVMASEYVKAVAGIAEPRVALLSIGEEDAKGNELVRGAHEMLRDDPHIHFVGNVESRDLFGGVCDVLACEGFVGNVVLKLMEGMAESVIEAILSELSASMPDQVTMIRAAAGEILAKYDFNEYGGAPLLGVAGICIIAHGASNERGIMNAVRVAGNFATGGVNERIVELLAAGQGTAP
ncbi:MAG: phosphate acyltransferase PlsX [Phycisphaerae bacterium]|nr:phosphate acyltransferase PlsX [Phycisphaerae bacterium]